MKISIIIPIYNSSLTLNECLNSIFNSSYKNYEVIVVSDKSTDNSVDIAKKYKTKVIELSQNRGPGAARNKGSEEAQGEILLFLDSDVIINKDSLNLIIDKFQIDEINAIQGIYSHQPNYKCVATQFYQSYLCYYVWAENKKYASTLVTGCFAVRKKIFNKLNGFDVNIENPSCEDEKFGYSLIENGYKIPILRNLQVVHRVNYGVIKFIKRRLTQEFDRIKFYLREKTYKNKIKQANYLRVILGIPVIALILLTIFSSFFYYNNLVLITFILLNVIYIWLHMGFLKFVTKNKGFKKAVGSLFMFYLDTFLMLIALSFGLLSFFILRNKY